MLIRFKRVVLISCLVGFSMASYAVEKTVYGRYENIEVQGIDKLIPAKLDTGAMTASFSAKDIKVFKKDGQQWVRFTPLIEGDNIKPLEYPLVKMGRIKRRAADVSDTKDSEDDADNDPNYTYRPEVKMKVCLGRQARVINVNLTDRSSFSYPFLIGAKALREFKAVVDPSLKYQSDATCSIK